MNDTSRLFSTLLLDACGAISYMLCSMAGKQHVLSSKVPGTRAKLRQLTSKDASSYCSCTTNRELRWRVMSTTLQGGVF